MSRHLKLDFYPSYTLAAANKWYVLRVATSQLQVWTNVFSKRHFIIYFMLLDQFDYI